MKIEITEKQMEQIILFAADNDMDISFAGSVMVGIGLNCLSDMKNEIERAIHKADQFEWKTKLVEMKYRKLMEAENG